MCRAIWVPGVAFLLGVAGCVSLPNLPFGPDAQEKEAAARDKELEALRVVGDVTEVGNAGPLAVSGVGLVTDLEGTGGALRGEWRSMLEKELRERKVENPSRLLDSPNNALVWVTAVIPAGCRKQDPIDLQVSLPPGSTVKSLRGGYLQLCVLRNYDTTKNLDPDYKGGNRLLQGHILAVGKGPLLVGFGDPNDDAELKKGRVWEGGVSLIERPFYLILKKDDKSARIANAVATRINTKFPEEPRKQDMVQRNRKAFLLDDVASQINETFEAGPLGQGDTALALGKDAVHARVPYAYRYNPERYLRVSRLIPLSDDAEQQSRYRARLAKMLQEPKDCVRAALRLEALGKESIPALKQGLTSPTPVVRFACAEALTYLGSATGVEELSNLAARDPMVRAYALIALAGLNESVCRIKLQELLTKEDAELRSGAFQALRLSYAHECRNEQELDSAMRRLGGENLQAFWLHQVPTSDSKAVNFAVAKRSEIILFGSDIRLVAPVKIQAGVEFILTAEPGDDRCFISRITDRSQQRKQCSLQLNEVLRTLVELGGQYPEAVDMLRKLDERGGLNCPVRVVSPPQTTPLEELIQGGESVAAAK